MRGLAISFLTLESVAAADCVRAFFFDMLIDRPVKTTLSDWDEVFWSELHMNSLLPQNRDYAH
jgi:hypothetical protein